MSELVAVPESGKRGEPLEICGYAGDPNITVAIGVEDPNSDDAWPQSDDHVATSDNEGRFCWTGTIPTQMEVAFGADAGELYETPPGSYVLTADYKGNMFAYGELDILD